MPTISDRIKELRKSADMTQEEFGQKFGVVKSTVSLYESGKSTPNDEIKKKICEYFGVSLDYLHGIEKKTKNLSNDIRTYKYEKQNNYFFFFFDDCLKDIFITNFRKALAEQELSTMDFSEMVSFDAEKCNAYYYGNCEPSLEDLIEISQKLDVSTDYLLGQIPKITNYEKKILNTFIKLNDDNKDILIGKAKELLKEQRHEESVAADKPLKKTGTENLGK